MIRHVVRAMAVLAAGVLVAATWPPVAVPLGVAVAVGAIWHFRSNRRLGAPYLVAGALLSVAALVLLMVAPNHDSTTMTNNPIRYCEQGQPTC